MGLGDSFTKIFTTQPPEDDESGFDFEQIFTDLGKAARGDFEERERQVAADELLTGLLGAGETFIQDPATGIPRPLGPIARQRLPDAIRRSRAAPRSFKPRPGEVLPGPAADLSTTAAFPVAASAQSPILSGSREDPFGFVVPLRHPPFGGSTWKKGLRALQA